MKLLLTLAITVPVIILLLIPQLRKYRGYILTAFAVMACAVGMLQTYRTAGLTLPFYNPMEQTFYQKDFATNNLYPDAILQLVAKDKTVYVKDDLDDYLKTAKKHPNNVDYYEDGKYWMYSVYHQKNMTEFLESVGAVVISDDAYNDSNISDYQLGDFEYLGYGNDMFRYLFPLSTINDEWSNSFYYYWYYSTSMLPMDVYMNVDNIEAADELVVLWDDKPNETIYVMTKEYYDTEVAADA